MASTDIITLQHMERSNGTIITVSAYRDGRYNIHRRKRWKNGRDVKHVSSTWVTRQQIMALGLSRELLEADRAFADATKE